MSGFSLISRSGFSSWSCCILLMSSSVLGFSTTSYEGKNGHCNNRNQHRSRRPRLRSNCDVSASTFALPTPSQQRQGCRQRQRQRDHVTSSTTLHLSFSTEVPIVSEVVATYTHCLKYHYFPTQSMTNAILTAVGDGIAQTEEAKKAADDDDNKLDLHTDINRNTNHYYDPKRGLVYFFKGLGSGLIWAWWFDMAEVWSMQLTQLALSHDSTNSFDFATDVLSVPAQTIRTVINILLEQFLVCPLLFSLWDIPLTSLMRGSPTQQVPAQIREKLVPLLVANGKVWTLVNVVTYNIPLEYRLLFCSAASIVSESINSGITSQPINVPETPPAVASPQRLSGSVNPIVEMGMGVSIDANVFISTAATIVAGAPLQSSSKNTTLYEF